MATAYFLEVVPSLETLMLELQAESPHLARLGIFQIAAFLSRISNAEVLRRAGSPKLLTDTIKDVQVAQLGRVLRSSPQQPLRKAAFAHGLSPVVSHYIRRVGRPRREWVPTVLEEAQRRCSGRGDLEILASDEKTWKKISTCTL